MFGVFAKLSAFFVSIPDCLNGGLLIIIAAIVMGPGVRVRTKLLTCHAHLYACQLLATVHVLCPWAVTSGRLSC